MAGNIQQRKSAVTTIFFDLDNTLILTKQGDKKTCDKVCNILVEKYQLPLNFASHACSTFLQNFRLCPHNPELNIVEWRILLWREALKEHARIAEEVYRLWLKLRYKNLALSHDVTSMLKKLHFNYSLGLITNGTSSSQWEKVVHLNLRPYFDCILVSGDYPWEKPHQNIFLKACKLLGVEPHNCIMVGDKLETDILGGKKANLAATVWISESLQLQNSHLRPDFILTSVTELPRLLSLRVPHCPDLDDSSSNSSDGS